MVANIKPIERVRGRALQRRRHRYFAEFPLCVMCAKQGHITAATELDHVIPLFKGGSDEPENFQALCPDCHRKKTALDTGKRYKPRIGIDGYPIDA